MMLASHQDFIAILALVALAANTALAIDPEDVCPDADPPTCKTWSYDGCNWCHCDPEVLTPACTTDEICDIQQEPYCRDPKCPDRCILYYDGCNDWKCDVHGNIMSSTDNYCKHPIYDPDNARCKQKLCPPTCKRWFDGCNKYRCHEDGELGYMLDPETTCDLDKYKPQKCLKYYNCDTDSGWTRQKMLWCCKTEGVGCMCEGQSGKCKKKNTCNEDGHVCQEYDFKNKKVSVCCPP